jgi:hypothetical protein
MISLWVGFYILFGQPMVWWTIPLFVILLFTGLSETMVVAYRIVEGRWPW